MKTAISIRNLSFSYGEDQVPLISCMNLDIHKGTVVAILGANGVGKTTLLYILLGLYPANTGEVCFFNKSKIGYGAGHIKQLIGMVSQNESIPFDLSVEEYVLLGRAPHLNLFRIPGGEDKRAVKNALATVGVSHLAACGMTRLSSGEKQLVNVARALTHNPDILLLDEPCSHLDLINTRQMLNLIKTIVRNGRTVVFSTHDPNAASAVADQVILLKKGKLVANGSPEQTLTQELLTDTYGGPIEVLNTSRGPLVLAI